jgi:hypothetical protein
LIRHLNFAPSSQWTKNIDDLVGCIELEHVGKNINQMKAAEIPNVRQHGCVGLKAVMFPFWSLFVGFKPDELPVD